MIKFEEAVQAILQRSETLGVTELSLSESLGSVLAEGIISTYDLPFFNNSAMDGYGVKTQDTESASKEAPSELSIKETIQAGEYSENVLSFGSAVKIFTGAPIPAGVDAVVMKELCEEKNGKVFIHKSAKLNDNIRFQGEEFEKGQEIILKGTKITPPVIGLLANLGCAKVKVYQKPKVSILVTGNELVPPGTPLKLGQIYDSNSYALIAALNEMGITEVPVFYTPDEKEETHIKFKAALSQHDVVITLGGVSVGDYDFVKEVVEAQGIETIFWRIAIKPGKPVYFGQSKNESTNQLIFGLPGNPVSALVTFYQLVRPALIKMMGSSPELSTKLNNATLQEPLKKRLGRLEFVRGLYSRENGKTLVKSTLGQSSHMLGGLSVANCLIHFPEDKTQLEKGDSVQIKELEWH